MITTVNGNVGIDKTTANALKLKQFFNSDVPVYQGAAHPLLTDIVDASVVHGESGMNGYDFPAIDQSAISDVHAVEAMKTLLLQSDTLSHLYLLDHLRILHYYSLHIQK